MTLTNEEIMNIGDTAEKINNKVDLDSRNRYQGINFIIASYQDGVSGYTIWSNGYCKQWGRTNALSYGGVQEITLLKEYLDENYSIEGAGTYKQTNGDSRTAWSLRVLSTNKIRYRSTTATNTFWTTSGFLKRSEYQDLLWEVV